MKQQNTSKLMINIKWNCPIWIETIEEHSVTNDSKNMEHIFDNYTDIPKTGRDYSKKSYLKH